jgi:hypothetical protein
MDEFTNKVRSVMDATKPEIPDSSLDSSSDGKNLPSQSLATKRWRFSAGVLFLSVFLLVGSFALPVEDHWLWAGLAVVLFFIGSWQLDKSNREFTKSTQKSQKPVNDSSKSEDS